MPGGFHPFHAGHAALYQSARRTFPDAEVYVAATNDTSARPFPFAVKEKLAKLAGVEPGHFVQVKSPFRAEEITANFDPSKDQLIFVRSEKDEGSQPKPGGVKKDGSPAYLQPLLGAKKLEPFAKHAYMAYLPTVEFGPGLTSATQIRTAWPDLDERRKTALVMSLYPATQSNPKLAATVRKMLDTAIVGDSINEGAPIVVMPSPERLKKAEPVKVRYQGDIVPPTQPPSTEKRGVKGRPGQRPMPKHDVEENQGWAATYTSEETRAYSGQQGAGMTAAYQRRENQPVDERKRPDPEIPAEYKRDPELYKLRQYAKQHYSQYADDPEMAIMKLLQRGLEHSEVNDQAHDQKIKALAREIQTLRSEIRQQQNSDYIEEKWSERYKRSIDCSNPKGFSQRAHCAGRKK